tara:strand:+ start:188 stop:724 length:537 start_codon:yes stop_codon:yes gene_type:complete
MLNRNKMKKADWNKEAKKYIASSREYIERKEESFQRCDTDGFLTQQVLADTARLEEARAELCKKQGKHDFLGLYDGKRRIKAKVILVEDKFTPWSKSKNPVWFLEDSEAERYGRKFMPFNNGRGKSRILNSFGLKELRVFADAWAKSTWAGWTHYIKYYRVDDECGQKDKLIESKQNA